MTRGPLGAWASPLTWPASILYGAVADAVLSRRAARAVALPLPTISIGNIAVGGSGKSPIVRWVAEELLRRGRRPMVITTGYGAAPGQPGDETLEHRERLPELVVSQGRDRAAAAAAGIAQGRSAGRAPDCIILDDGFQRRDVRRQLDVVVVGAAHLHGRRIPLGWLREPPQALARAGQVVCWEEEASLIAHDLPHIAPDVPWTPFRRTWDGLRVASPGDVASESAAPLGWLEGKRVEVWLGLGNATPFLRMLEGTGARIFAVERRRDHAVYTPAWVARRLARPAVRSIDAVVTSEKDWVKVREALRGIAPAVPFARPLLRVEPCAAASPISAALDAFASVVVE